MAQAPASKQVQRVAPQEDNRPPAFGYARVSTGEQAREGVSLAAQQAKIEAYALLNDFRLVEVFIDDGKSAKDIERPEFQRMLGAIEVAEGQAVIVYKLDRLTRSTRDLLWLIEVVFKKSATRLVSLSEQIDTSTAAGKFFLTMMGGLAQMERELISERTRTALDFKRQRGDRLGTTPMGFVAGGGELVPHAAELAIVHRIRTERRQGRSFRAIASALNAEGIATKRGCRWQPSTVHYIVNNERYVEALLPP